MTRILSLSVKTLGGPFAVGAVLRDGRGYRDVLDTFGGHVRIRRDHLTPNGVAYVSSVIGDYDDCDDCDDFRLRAVFQKQNDLFLGFHKWFRSASKEALVVVDNGVVERTFLSRCALKYSQTRTQYVLVDFQLQELANMLLTSGFIPESNRVEMARPHMHHAERNFSDNPLWTAHLIAWCATEALYHRARLLKQYPEFPGNEQLELDL